MGIKKILGRNQRGQLQVFLFNTNKYAETHKVMSRAKTKPPTNRANGFKEITPRYA